MKKKIDNAAEENAPISKKRKFFNHVKRFLSNPANIILIVFLVILVFMIFYPLFTLI